MSSSLKKGPFIDTHLLEKIEVMNRGGREEGHQDLVAALDGDPRDGRAHAGGAQREEVHPGLRHREHGRAQARRVRADPARSRGTRRRRREGGERRSGSREAGSEAHDAKRKPPRATSAPRPRRRAWCSISIRGKDVNQALATLQFTRKGIAADVEKVLRSAIANAQQKDGFSGDVDRLFVSACYAEPGAVGEAGAAGPDGPGVPRAEADGASDRAGTRAAARRSCRRRRRGGRTKRAPAASGHVRRRSRRGGRARGIATGRRRLKE